MKNLIKKTLAGIITLMPTLTLAAPNFGLTGQETTISTVGGVEALIGKIVNWISGLFFVVAIVYIIYAAFLFLTSGGDTEKVTTAKNQLLYSIIAIAVALLAFSMKTIVRNFLG